MTDEFVVTRPCFPEWNGDLGRRAGRLVEHLGMGLS